MSSSHLLISTEGNKGLKEHFGSAPSAAFDYLQQAEETIGKARILLDHPAGTINRSYYAAFAPQRR